jgi:type II secretory pathway pseudopilin PulG
MKSAANSAETRRRRYAMRGRDGCVAIERRRGGTTRLGGAQRHSAGFTYIGVLLLVAVMGISLTVVSQVWQTMQRIDKEDELLFVGDQMRRALALYAANASGGQRYPQGLEDLLKDPRYPDVRRYLRRIYPDPITGRADWGLAKGPGDGIMGVYSLSEDEPIKKTEFRFRDRDFEGKTKYSEWVFIPKSSLRRDQPKPGGKPK